MPHIISHRNQKPIAKRSKFNLNNIVRYKLSYFHKLVKLIHYIILCYKRELYGNNTNIHKRSTVKLIPIIIIEKRTNSIHEY